MSKNLLFATNILRRFLYFFGLVAALLALILILLMEGFNFSSDVRKISFTNSNFDTAIVVGVLLILGLYLGGYFLSYLNDETDKKVERQKILNKKFEELKSKIDSEAKQLNDLYGQARPDYLKKFIEESSSEIARQSLTKFNIEINKRIEKDIDDQFIQDLLHDQISKLKSRIENLIESLSRRSNLNLMIGAVTGVLGVTVLAVSVLVYANNINDSSEIDWDAVFVFLSRFSLVFLIQVFSYIFLRFHRLNLEDVKYFQNELTNIEEIEVGIQISLFLKDQEKISASIDKLLNVERNFVLEKGQTTAKIEIARLENSHWETVANTLGNASSSVFSRVNSSNK